MSDAAPSKAKLAGQLGYMFEDDPALRAAPVQQLAERLNREDRLARAIAKYPHDNDREIAAHLPEFAERITAADVEAALADALGGLGDRDAD